MKNWTKGYRIVLTCIDCGVSIWCKNIGETVKCNCEKPKTLYQDAQRFEFDINTRSATISKRKVERAY